MTADQAVARAAAHENALSQLIFALQSADALLYVQEKLQGFNHAALRAQIKAALDRAYREM